MFVREVGIERIMWRVVPGMKGVGMSGLRMNCFLLDNAEGWLMFGGKLYPPTPHLLVIAIRDRLAVEDPTLRPGN
jgi:hypothetical protein